MPNIKKISYLWPLVISLVAWVLIFFILRLNDSCGKSDCATLYGGKSMDGSFTCASGLSGYLYNCPLGEFLINFFKRLPLNAIGLTMLPFFYWANPDEVSVNILYLIVSPTVFIPVTYFIFLFFVKIRNKYFKDKDLIIKKSEI
jgi:hypothetical protein